MSSIPLWATALAAVIFGLPVAGAAVIGAVAFWRGGGGTALTTLETANRVLEGRVRELETIVRENERLIAELSARTDIGAALQPLTKWTELHEKRDAERFAKTLAVLDLIAGRLGSDTKEDA